MAERCEWNPMHQVPASEPRLTGDCENDATLALGYDGQWHVCERCAAMPRFARYTVRKPLALMSRVVE